MSARLLKTATSNAFSTTLNGNIAAGDTTIALTSTTGLQAPGVLVIDRQDSVGTNTPTLREFITYTGISTNNITGVTRGVAGSQAQSHNSGGNVEETMSVTHWGDLVDFLTTSHDSAGNILTSLATISTVRVLTHLNASGASISGRFPLHPVWVVSGGVSNATTSVGKPLPMPQVGEFQSFSMVLRTPASGASLFIDINKNGTSIFTDQNTRLLIPGGGTYVSTASIGTRTFVPGDIFTVDIDGGGGSGSDLTILGRAL